MGFGEQFVEELDMTEEKNRTRALVGGVLCWEKILKSMKFARNEEDGGGGRGF